MEKLRLGAQMYTVRNFTNTKEELDSTLGKIAEIGYKYVQLSGLKYNDAKEIAKLLSKHGLKAPLTHTAADRIIGETEKVIEEHDVLGCSVVGLGSIPRKYWDGNDIDGFIRDFMPAMERITAAGKIFAFHNHFLEFSRYKGRCVLDYLFEACGGLLQVIFDTYWGQYGGVDPAKYIADHAGAIAALHLKDMQIKNGKPDFDDVLSGNMNFDAITEAAKLTSGLCFVEHDNSEDPFASLKISYDNIKERYDCYE
ncbi:MAG: sugar phosphate isomerase/epimerase [Clostridia bacterium]|nr:sugar phosphate isomerase/epimerase [Clostridia bacterium]